MSGEPHDSTVDLPHVGTDPELLADGQEEVFSWTAVERGIVKDPPAMGPVDGCDPDPKAPTTRNSRP